MSNNQLPLAFLGDARPAFLAHIASRLDREICDQTEVLADAIGIRAPVRTFSALLFLARTGPATLVEIAQSDRQSHQLVSQRLKPLESLGLIERSFDLRDARRRPYGLTPIGEEEVARVELLIESLTIEFNSLFERMGVNLLQALDRTLAELQNIPLVRLGSDKNKQPA